MVERLNSEIKHLSVTQAYNLSQEMKRIVVLSDRMMNKVMKMFTLKVDVDKKDEG